MGNRVLCTATLLVALGPTPTATAQSTGELWGNLTIDWLASERLTYTLDVEPKVQVTTVTKQSRFSNLDVWPSVDLAVSGWLDAHGEFLTGVSNEQDGSNSTEITERMGVRLHVLSRLIQEHDARRGAEREAQPRRRGTFGTLLRFEHRDLLHSDSPTTSSCCSCCVVMARYRELVGRWWTATSTQNEPTQVDVLCKTGLPGRTGHPDGAAECAEASQGDDSERPMRSRHRGRSPNRRDER